MEEFTSDYVSAQNLHMGDFIDGYRITYLQQLDGKVKLWLQKGKGNKPIVKEIDNEKIIHVMKPISSYCSRGYDMRG